MTIGWPILSAIIFLPMLGALFILVIRGDDEIAIRNARYVALWTTMITFLLSLVIWIEFDPTTSVFQFEEKRDWLGGSISYHLGVDGIEEATHLLGFASVGEQNPGGVPQTGSHAVDELQLGFEVPMELGQTEQDDIGRRGPIEQGVARRTENRVLIRRRETRNGGPRARVSMNDPQHGHFSVQFPFHPSSHGAEIGRAHV